MVRIGAACEEPGDHFVAAGLGGGVEGSGAVAIACSDQSGVGGKERDGGFVVARADGLVDLLLHGRDGGVGAARGLAPLLLLLFDDGDDFGEFAVAGEREGGGGVAVGVDALASVRAGLHEEAHHGGVAAEDGVVEGAVLVVLSHVHADQLGAGLDELADGGEVAGVHGLGEPRDVGAIDESFEFGPTVETIGAGELALGLAESEARPTTHQFFGLFAELFEVRLPRQAARGDSLSGHGNLLSSCPASA